MANRARVTFELIADMGHLSRMDGGRIRKGAECCLECCLLRNAWDRAESAHGVLFAGFGSATMARVTQTPDVNREWAIAQVWLKGDPGMR
jgi:hypothetical protein